MTPVDQTLFGEAEGNCLAASVASIFGLPLDAVPNFAADGTSWMRSLRAWAATRGFAVIRLAFGEDHVTLDRARAELGDWAANTLMIVTGKAERGLLHATVWRGGELVHDPHPSRSGILDVLDAIVFVPHDPGKAERKAAEFDAVKREICDDYGRRFAYPSVAYGGWQEHFERGRRNEAKRRGWDGLYDGQS